MNQPLVAAVTGIVFGSALCISAFTYYSHHSHRDCHRGVWHHSMPAQPTLAPAPELQSPPAIAPLPDPMPTSCAPSNQTILYAQRAYVEGRFDAALRAAQLCTTDAPTRAYRIIGAAACNLHDMSAINVAYQHLDAAGRQYLTYACRRQGLAFETKGRTLIPVKLEQ